MSRQPLGTQTKVIEDGGLATCMGLVKSNQFPRDDCQRADCLLCFQRDGNTKQTQCQSSNVGYEGQCARCPAKFTYIGETSKTGYTRIKQHFNNYRAAAAAKLPALPRCSPECGDNKNERDAKSWMWEHTRENHNGLVGEDGGMNDYRMKVTGKLKKCLQRQVNEGVLIEKCEAECEAEGGKLLNSKKEYFTAKTIQTLFKQW